VNVRTLPLERRFAAEGMQKFEIFRTGMLKFLEVVQSMAPVPMNGSPPLFDFIRDRLQNRDRKTFNRWGTHLRESKAEVLLWQRRQTRSSRREQPTKCLDW